MYFNHKNEINLDHLNNKKLSLDKNSINEDLPPSTTLKLGRRDKFQEETMPFLGEYDPPVPYPVSTNLIHNNGSNSSGIGSYTGQTHHYGNAPMRNSSHREGRIVTTDVEDLSTDDENTCPANNKDHDDMFDSISSNPASSIMPQEMSHPSALLNSIPPPPSEPPPSTPRDSYQESVFPKCSMIAPVSHNGMQGIRGLMDQDHILQQIPGVMESESNQIPYLIMGPTNNRVAAMGTIGRYRNQMPISEATTMATLPHTHSQTGFAIPSIPRGPGSVSGTSNVYENPYNSLNRHNSKPMKTVSTGGFPSSNSTHEMGYPMLAPSGMPQNHILYRQGSIRSPPNHSFSDPFFGIGKTGSGRCSWTCIRISLFGLAILLLLSLIAYFAAKSVWLEGRLNKRFAQDPVVIGLFDPKNLPVLISPLTSYKISLKPLGVWSGRWVQNTSNYLHFNFTIEALTSLGVFSRINSVPTIVRYSFFDRISGGAWRQVILDGGRSRVKRSINEQNQESTGIVNYFEKGLWFISIVNDQPREENIHFALNTKVSMRQSCPEMCNKRGTCGENGQCECFTGFRGRGCSQVDSPKVCSGHGNYFQGRCLCNAEWKGPECETIWFECEYPACSGNGDCVSGECICKSGYSGKNCSNVACVANCSSNGVCQRNGFCRCFDGWDGRDCSKRKYSTGISLRKICKNNGQLTSDGTCKCAEGFYGDTCEKRKCLEKCYNGRCLNNGTCVCNTGYKGRQCDEMVCDRRCYIHGVCIDGKCSCQPGWNGKHCTLDGCPNHCSNTGQCQLNSANEYYCACFPNWKGLSCNITKENKCDDGIDNDNDGLTDCQDPDCCPTEYCESLTNQKQKLAEESCPLMESLQLLLLTTKLARPGSAFHEQIEFLTKRKYTSNTLNEKKISIVRGKVIQSDGSPFQGCRVQDRMRLVNGHTFTDKQGIFDLVVEGGSLVQLEIIRHPGGRFTGYYNVYVPINEFVNIGDFELKDLTIPKIEEPPILTSGCFLDDRSVHDPSILEGPRILSDWSSDVIPIYNSNSLSMAFDNGVLVNSIDLKETGLKLMHRSSRVKGFKSSLLVLILGKRVPPNLKEIRLKIDVAGQNISRRLEPDPYLTYTFHWDRLNAYNRLMYGLAALKVRVGYIYENCSQIFWETKMTVINGHDLAAKDIGNWNLNNRHIFDYNHGIVYRGDGSHLFLTQTNWRTKSIAGRSNELRDPNICSECDGGPKKMKFLILFSVLSDDKGRIIIVDGKYIRILSKAGQFNRNWAMMAPFYLKFIRQTEDKFRDISLYLAKHENNPSINNDLLPGEPKFYISDSDSRSIWVINPEKETFKLVVGEQCLERTCIKEKLVYPRGMAMTYNFSLYFADGRAIKMISMKDLTIHNVIGDASALGEHARLPSCSSGLLAMRTRLKGPTSLKYNQIDNSIYFVDNMEMVYRLGLNNHMVSVVAGNSQGCPVPPSESDTILATSHKFTDIRDIDLSPSGELFIAEKSTIYIVKSDGYLYSVVGDVQNKPTFQSISSITVTMFGELIVADNGQQQIFSVHYKQSVKQNDLYQVLSPDTREMYSFNNDGQHASTESSITGTKLYSLHFRLNSINGWLSKIISPSGHLQFKVHRDTQSRATQLETPSGINYNVTLDDRKRIINLAMPSCFWRFQYNEQDLLISIQQCDEIAPYRFSYYPESGRLKSVIRPSGITTDFVEHPSFYEFIRSQLQSTHFVKGFHEYRLASTALTPYNSLIYPHYGGDVDNARPNKNANIVLLQLQIVGPSNQIKLSTGFQPKLMSLVDSHSKVEYKTHVTIYSHLEMPDGLRFTRKVVFKTPNPMKNHTSEWLYRIFNEANSLNSRGKRSNIRVFRNYQVNIDDNYAPYSNDESISRFALHPRIFKVNGMKKFQVYYESENRQEKYSMFKNHEQTVQLFKIQYDQDHHILKITPSTQVSSLAELSVVYTGFGLIARINWIKPLMQIDYDQFNRTTKIYNAYMNDEFLYRYDSDLVVNKIIEISNGRNGRYRLLYDKDDRLESISTPSDIMISVKQLISIGYRRILYRPYGVTANFIYDFDMVHGNLFRLIYPSRMYQINFFYSSSNQLRDVIYGDERITFSCDDTDDLVRQITKIHRSMGFVWNQTIEYYGPLVSNLVIDLQLPSPNLDIVTYDSEIIYSYDEEMQVKRISLVLIDKTHLKSNIRLESSMFYNSINQLIQWDEFIFDIDLSNRIKLPHDQSFIETKYNQNGQLSKRFIKMPSGQVSIEITYNEGGRNPLLISSYKIRKMGNSVDFHTMFSYYLDSNLITNANSVDSIEYEYYVDGRLRSMKVNGGAKIDYNYDEKTGLLKSCGLVSYLYNDDGFLTLKRNGKQLEKFSYNAFGLLQEYQLTESSSKILKRIEYFYDSRHRLIVQRDLMNPKAMLQYFYTDPIHLNRLTHMYDHKSKQLSTYYYESSSGHLFSIRVDKIFYYVLCDFLGSPRTIVSSNSEIVWDRDYDIFGDSKSSKDWPVHIPIGFGGHIFDIESGMVFMDNRVYDPTSKSFTTFKWFGLFQQLQTMKLNPFILNSYQFHFLPQYFDSKQQLDFSNMLKPDFWMDKIQMNTEFMVTEKALQTYRQITSLPDELLLKSAFEQFKFDSIHSRLADHNARSFQTLSCLQNNELLAHDLLPYYLLNFSPISSSIFSHHPNISISLRDNNKLHIVSKSDYLDSPFNLIANALFRNTTLLNIYSSRGDVILIYLVKDCCNLLKADLHDLGLNGKTQHDFDQNFNLSVTQLPHQLTEVVLHQRHFIVSVRYGSSIDEQTALIMKTIKSETEKLFWANKRKQLYRNELMRNQILVDHKNELITYTLLKNSYLDDWFNTTRFPLIFDDQSVYRIKLKPSV